MDLQRIREQEFPVTQERRFFNHAATSSLSRRVAAAMERQTREHGTLGSEDSAQIDAHIKAQRFALLVRDGRLRLVTHFYHTMDGIDALLEALP